MTLSTDELRDALDGLHAYDSGSTDSGIHDENLRRRVIDQLHAIGDNEFRLVFSRLIRDMWISEEALAQGYGYEDLLEFCQWLGERMELDVL